MSEQQKSDVIFFLGHPAKTINPDSTHYNGILDDRMKNLLATTVTRVDELIALIKSTREKLDATRDDANVSKVGEIMLDPKYTSKYIQSQHNRYLRELSTTLDIPQLGSSGRISF